MPKLGYICLIKAEAPRISSVANDLKRLTRSPTRGIEVHGAWATFGAHDAVVVFSAETRENAMQFIQSNVSNINGIRSTETLTGQPLPPFTPGASPESR